MDLLELLSKAVQGKASDLHISVAASPVLRINGELISMDIPPLKPQEIENVVQQILTEKQFLKLNAVGELDTPFSNPGLGRFRVNVYKQRGSYGLAIRVVELKIPTIEELGFPAVIKSLSDKERGLILVTGPTGSGKSTTLASMIDYINKNKKRHILTLEDPIEYLYKHDKSIVNQREIGTDSKNFAAALRAALRQDPDVILVGEIRDLETMTTAISAAETGHLVLSTLHTLGAAKTIDRIIDAFPTSQQGQIRMQLSSVMEGVISQQLLPRVFEDQRVAALEIMVATPAIRNLIREGKTHQINSSIQTGSKHGMQMMDKSIIDLYMKRIIDRETAIMHAIDLDALKRML